MFTTNLPAKVASVVLAALLWAVIRKSQLTDPAKPQPAPVSPKLEFGAGINGK